MANCNWLKTVILLLTLTLTVSGQFSRDKINIGTQKLRKLPNEKCGVTAYEEKIIIGGGERVGLGAYPWMAALGFTRGSSNVPTWACGGSLISDQYVLAAAHCLDPTLTAGFKLSVVRLGDLDLTSTDDNVFPTDVGIEKIILHPEFNNSIKTNDIGLIKLDRKIEFTDLIKPICLPSSEFQNNIFVNSWTVVAEWGLDEHGVVSSRLLEAELQVTDLAECRRNLTSVFPQVLIDQRVVCAYAPGKDSCRGDSGGPLMMYRMYNGTRRVFALGIDSYGKSCLKEGFPGVYTRISEYMEWLIENMDL